jgi:hypothetical protein
LYVEPREKELLEMTGSIYVRAPRNIY